MSANKFRVCPCVHRGIAVGLILPLLSASTPAAPQMIVALAKESSVSFLFWYHSRGFAKLVQGQGPGDVRKQETQTDRNAKVHKLKIFPGNVTVFIGASLNLAAVAYDKDDVPIGGVKITWTMHDEGRNRSGPLSPRGEFRAIVTGTFKITAEGAGKTDKATIVVIPGPPRAQNTKPQTNAVEVSNVGQIARAELPTRRPEKSSKSGARSSSSASKSRLRLYEKSRSFAHNGSVMPPAPIAPDDGWNGGNFLSSSDPNNGVGDPPGHPVDGGAGSGNFQFAAPIYSAPGRGINISLAAAYNSRVWNKSGSQMTYDIDRGWPAPGWSLGFGKILWMGSGGAMMVDADGTRHNYAGTVNYFPSPNQTTYFWLHSSDGMFIDYSGVFWGGDGATNGSATARLANGTTISYNAVGPGAVYPTQIVDPNGNYTTITYVPNAAPRIQTVTDSLARVIQFYYDSNNLLTAIQAAGFNNGPGSNAVMRDLVRFHYHQISVTNGNYSFNGMTTMVRDQSPWVMDAIFYPATNTGYWFNDSDSYSTYGMLRKVSERRNMSFSCPNAAPPGQGPTEQCTINSSGLITREETYNYPAYVGDTSGTQSSGLTDAPTYTSMGDRWTPDGSNTFASATTGYEVHENVLSPTNILSRTVEITLPNGTKSKQYSYYAPGQWNDGLVYHDVIYVTDENNPLQSSTSSWEQGEYGAPRPTQVQATNNEIGRSRNKRAGRTMARIKPGMPWIRSTTILARSISSRDHIEWAHHHPCSAPRLMMHSGVSRR